MNPLAWTIGEAEVGLRLDKFLVAKLSEHSRSQIQKLIEVGGVLVNGERAMVHRFLKVGDAVTVNGELKISDGEQGSDQRLLVNGQIPSIIAEISDYLIINKPSGLVVHPAPGVKEETLVEYLVERYPELKGVGEDSTRPGIVHRLDREVSGVMVIARTQAMFQHLKQQFQGRGVEKTYRALVHRPLEHEVGEITFPIARSKAGKMVSRPLSQESEETREAKTTYELARNFRNYAEVLVRIETGRTHQIRSHFQAINHPVVGDPLYRNKRYRDPEGLGRMFLHAERLCFSDLAGERQCYEAPLPDDLCRIVDGLH